MGTNSPAAQVSRRLPSSHQAQHRRRRGQERRSCRGPLRRGAEGPEEKCRGRRGGPQEAEEEEDIDDEEEEDVDGEGEEDLDEEEGGEDDEEGEEKLKLQPGTATAIIIMNSTVRKKKSAIADAPDSSFCCPRVLDFLSFSQLSSS